jgi:Flp pilus assembly pilin Flp
VEVRLRQVEPKERGATLVEMALVAPLIFTAIFAVVEFGLAFKDYLTVSSGAGQGARAASTFGNDDRADILVLRDVESSLATGAISGSGTTVKVANPLTGVNTLYTYMPGTGCSGGSCCDWQPCPDPLFPLGIYTVPTWDPAGRDVSAPFTDAIQVEVAYTHRWLTGFFLNTSIFTVSATHQIEPQTFG